MRGERYREKLKGLDPRPSQCNRLMPMTSIEFIYLIYLFVVCFIICVHKWIEVSCRCMIEYRCNVHCEGTRMWQNRYHCDRVWITWHEIMLLACCVNCWRVFCSPTPAVANPRQGDQLISCKTTTTVNLVSRQKKIGLCTAQRCFV